MQNREINSVSPKISPVWHCPSLVNQIPLKNHFGQEFFPRISEKFT